MLMRTIFIKVLTTTQI